MLKYQDIIEARDRIADGIVETGCPPSFALAEAVGGTVYLKSELRQRTGSFKERGALNKLLQLDEATRRAGVIAASAGNHAQALAYHCARLSTPCTIVMPESAPLVKVTKTRGYGARVIQTGETISDGMATVNRIASADGLTLVHAFDDLGVMAGQGTIGLEILDQVADVSTVLVPIGGGGMISGIATAIKEQRPSARVIGVEAAASPGALESLRKGEPVKLERSDTLADGIAVKQIGRLTFPHMQTLVDDVLLVDEEDIVRAIFFLLESEKVIVEGGGAVAVAALLANKISLDADDVTVCLLSGGNIDMNILSKIIDRGLWADGRLTRLAVVVRDRPGYLNQVTTVIAIEGANILNIEHTRAFGDVSVGHVSIEMEIETRGRKHVKQIVTELRRLGHEVEEVS